MKNKHVKILKNEFNKREKRLLRVFVGKILIFIDFFSLKIDLFLLRLRNHINFATEKLINQSL